MRSIKRAAAILVILIACAVPALAQAPQSTPPANPQQQNEFVPLDQLPPQERLPAPRLLIAAYCFVLAALFLYVMSVSRRLGQVRREVERLESDIKRSGRA